MLEDDNAPQDQEPMAVAHARDVARQTLDSLRELQRLHPALKLEDAIRSLEQWREKYDPDPDFLKRCRS
jgi:hypothetical protein